MGQYTSIDLFAGIGGIRLGFERAFGESISTVFVSEFDEPACKTYQANFGDNPKISGDITQIKASEVPDFDICLAGFPCQAFSMAGQRKGFKDDFKGNARGVLFFDMMRICTDRKVKPKVIFCENVKGLPSHDKGRTFNRIIDEFKDNGYTPYSDLLNSKDFGVPQNRERIYIVAFRNDIDPGNFKFPKKASKADAENEKKSIAEILDKAPISSRYYLSDTYLATLRKHKAHHESLGHGFGYVVRDLDGIAGTIVCGGMGRERNLIVDHRKHSMTPVTNIKGEINKEDIRKMTPREWARLQGFPEKFEFPLKDTQTYKQLGNSVTVPVVRAIAEKIKEVLDAQGEQG